MKTLKVGSDGLDVRVLQRLLGITADGDFGPMTESSVETKQERANIGVDGICGPQTWAHIAASAKHLRKGDNGDDVRALQMLLGMNGDGKFGAETEAAVKNYQMLFGLESDGIVGDKTWKALLFEVVEVEGSFKQPEDYKQFSSKWGGLMYSIIGDKKQTIKSSGCGPTAACGPIEMLKGEKLSPDQACKLAIGWGCRTKNSGTSTSFFRKLADHYDLEYESTTDENKVSEALKEGAYVIARMGPGYWTKGGHYITLWKCDDTYFYANDPGSSTRKKAAISSFKKESKDYHILRCPALKAVA